MHRRAVRRIWRGLGLQNASQNHTLGTKMLGRSSFWAVLAAVFPQNGVSEGPEVDFGALGNRFGRPWGQLFLYFASFLSMFVSIFCIIWTNFPHEFLAACMDFQCPLAPQLFFSGFPLLLETILATSSWSRDDMRLGGIREAYTIYNANCPIFMGRWPFKLANQHFKIAN